MWAKVKRKRKARKHIFSRFVRVIDLVVVDNMVESGRELSGYGSRRVAAKFLAC